MVKLGWWSQCELSSPSRISSWSGLVATHCRPNGRLKVKLMLVWISGVLRRVVHSGWFLRSLSTITFCSDFSSDFSKNSAPIFCLPTSKSCDHLCVIALKLLRCCFIIETVSTGKRFQLKRWFRASLWMFLSLPKFLDGSLICTNF